jgi:F-type H+-transporting ATPase subunit b
MDLDVTIFIQTGIFLLVLFGLNPILIKPIQRIIEARHAGTGGKSQDTDRLSSEAAEKQQKYEARIAVARKEAGEKREGLRNEGRQSERQLVEEARKRAEATVEKGRADIETQATEARGALNTEVDALAQQLAVKVLGRELA